MEQNPILKGLKKVVALVAALVMLLTCFTAVGEAHVKIPLTIKTSGLTYPGNLYSGNTFSMRGEITASYGVITCVHGWIVNRENKRVVMDKAVFPNRKTVNMRNTLNTKMKFGELCPGKYTLKVAVTAKSGSKKVTKTIMSKNFTVYAARPNINVSGGVFPSRIKQGNKAPIRGLVRTNIGVLSEVRAAVYNEDGVAVMTAKYKPNKKTFDLRYSLNKDFTFGALPEGLYTLQVVAKAVDGKATRTVTLVKKTLEVY